MSKCYTYVLNKRLEVWAESQGKLVEKQGAFRKGRSTVDHSFVMISMVEKALAKSKGKLYVAFVDFRKAYDSVNRNILWDVLRRAGAGRKDAKGTESNVQLCCGFRQSGRWLYDRRVLLPSRAQAGRV